MTKKKQKVNLLKKIKKATGFSLPVAAKAAKAILTYGADCSFALSAIPGIEILGSWKPACVCCYASGEAWKVDALKGPKGVFKINDV